MSKWKAAGWIMGPAYMLVAYGIGGAAKAASAPKKLYDEGLKAGRATDANQQHND